MKTILPPGVVLAFAVIFTPAGARSVWYAQPSPDGKIGRCVEAEQSIDAAWAHVEKGWAKASGNPRATCDLKLDGTAEAAGFMFDCGDGGDHCFFRTKENCEAFKRVINSNTPFNIEEFAPKGVARPNAWIASLTACLNTLAKKPTLVQVGLQAVSTVCECLAAKVANTNTPPENAAPDALVACLKDAPDSVRAKLLAAYKASLEAAPGPAVAPGKSR